MILSKKYLLSLVLFLLIFCSCGYNDNPFKPCDDYCPCGDGKISAQNIARWDGSQWLPLGSGVNGVVKRIVVDNITNELYVFGLFTNAGGVPVIEQAKWSEKTQSWSAIGTQLQPTLPFEQAAQVAVSNGKIYYCKLINGRIYNPDSTFSEKRGLFLWDGFKWELLDKLFELDQYSYYIYPYDIRIQGNILYISGTSYNGTEFISNNLYIYDLFSKKIIDSIPYSDLISKSNIVVYDHTSISSDGIYIEQGDGLYKYVNGIQKKIIQKETKEDWHYSLVSSSSEYVSLWNYYSLFSPDTKKRYMTVYDIKGDSTYNHTIPLNPNFPVQQVNITYMSGHTLYAGGAFYINDNGANVRNIGAFDLRQKKWYDISGGVCGPVHAIAEMNGSIYVGGEFTTAGKK